MKGVFVITGPMESGQFRETDPAFKPLDSTKSEIRAVIFSPAVLASSWCLTGVVSWRSGGKCWRFRPRFSEPQHLLYGCSVRVNAGREPRGKTVLDCVVPALCAGVGTPVGRYTTMRCLAKILSLLR